MWRALVFRRKPIFARRKAPTGLRVEDEAGGLLLASAKVGGICSRRYLKLLAPLAGQTQHHVAQLTGMSVRPLERETNADAEGLL